MPLPPTLLARLAKRGIINPKHIKLAGTNACFTEIIVLLSVYGYIN